MDPSLAISNPCGDNLHGVAGHLFLSLINTLMATKCPLGSPDQYPSDYAPQISENEEFDFIVIGGGSAGSVVANRLTEIEEWKVLVVEAGGYPSAVSDIPAILFSLQGTHEDWQHRAEVVENFGSALVNNTSKWPRGKTLGGSSSINAMLYVRGNKKDYDRWAEMGNTGWDWDGVSRHFREMEDFQENPEKSEGYGRGGYLGLSRYHSEEPVKETITEAARELGIPTLGEEQPLKPIGFFDSPMTVEDGTRQNSAKAFLGKVKHRKNLYVALNSIVEKIIIDKDTKTARGVTIRRDGKSYDLYAKKEVIVSAGTVSSPQLLMLSGIGPKRHLGSVGIDLVKDLPVGENLQDHTLFFGLWYSLDKNAVLPTTPKSFIDDLYHYFMHRTGEATRIRTTNLLGFINTKNDSVYPDVEIINLLCNPNDFLFTTALSGFGIAEEVKRSLVGTDKENPLLSFYPTVLNPKSRGRILLKSKDPEESVEIRHGYLTDEDGSDLKITLEAVRFLERLMETEAFVKHKPEIIKPDISACNGLPFRSDEYWRCSIRHMTSTFYHPVGTCKMGVDSDKTAVVDPRLRVHGVKNLRVVDASVMPLIVSANTNAASMMIGHKGGEMIVEDWLERHDEL